MKWWRCNKINMKTFQLWCLPRKILLSSLQCFVTQHEYNFSCINLWVNSTVERWGSNTTMLTYYPDCTAGTISSKLNGCYLLCCCPTRFLPLTMNSCPSTLVSPFDLWRSVIQWCISSGVSALQWRTRLAVMITNELGLWKEMKALQSTYVLFTSLPITITTVHCLHFLFRQILSTSKAFISTPLNLKKIKHLRRLNYVGFTPKCQGCEWWESLH